MPLTLLITSGGMIGAGVTSIIGEGSNIPKIQEKVVNNEKLNEQKTPLKEKPSKEKKKAPQPKRDDIVWEYVLFDYLGNRMCGAGNSEWLDWRGTRDSKCSREWMKLYSQRQNESSKLWMKVKTFDNWALSHFLGIWRRGVIEKGGKACWPREIEDNSAGIGWKVLYCDGNEEQQIS